MSSSVATCSAVLGHTQGHSLPRPVQQDPFHSGQPAAEVDWSPGALQAATGDAAGATSPHLGLGWPSDSMYSPGPRGGDR